MSASSFPDDLVPDLFARLPPKSLLRFRCVSKSWRALIDSPEFITMHLRQSVLRSNAQEYVFWVRMGDEFKIYAARFDSARNFNITVRRLKDPPISEPELSESRLVGSCNGLLCMKDMHNQIILWNPWIRKHFKLPYSPPHKFSSNAFGFGYDDNTQDYKVVRLVSLLSISPRRVVRLYSLKSNSWRKLQHLPFSFTNQFSGGAGVLANCALHWFARSEGILAVDLRTEDYRLMQIPESVKNNCIWRLGVLDGCLCLFPKLFGFSSKLVDSLSTWIMKDYGREDSWTPLVLQVSSPGPFFHMHLITGNSEGNTQLFLQKNEGDVLWYDTTGKKWVGMGKFPGSAHVIEGFNCVGSLVLPYDGGKGKGMKRTRGD